MPNFGHKLEAVHLPPFMCKINFNIMISYLGLQNAHFSRDFTITDLYLFLTFFSFTCPSHYSSL